MTVWQHQWFRRNLAAQFAKRHDRPGEGHCTDEDPEEHFGQMNIDQNRFHARFVIQVAVKAYQHRRQTDKAVQNRDQLWHLGHFHTFRQTNTNRTTDDHRHQDPRDVTGIRPEDGGNQCDRHTRDTKVVPALRRFVFGKPRQTANKQDCSNNICRCD
ncbi:hypothetical protein D3C71_1023840 [compost metagenome]